jgi:hypothetical protein
MTPQYLEKYFVYLWETLNLRFFSYISPQHTETQQLQQLHTKKLK